MSDLFGFGQAIGGVAQAVGSIAASNIQADAGKYVANLQHQTQLENAARVAPFTNAGIGATNILASLYGIPTSPLSVAAGSTTPTGGNPLASTASPSATGAGSSGYQIIQNDYSGSGGGQNPPAPGYSLIDASGNAVYTGPSYADVAAHAPSIVGAPSQTSASTTPSTTATQTLSGGIPGAPTTFAYDPAAYGLGNGVFKPTEAELVQTPGYKFTLDQGLRAVQNSAAARGLGTSGAALKGAAQFATGLADQTLNTQANIYGNNVARTAGIFNSNLSNYLNPLEYLGTLGENAGVQTGAQAVQSSANQGAALIGAANTGAAGIVGAGNAISNGFNNAANTYQNYQLYSALTKGNGGGGDYVDSGAF